MKLNELFSGNPEGVITMEVMSNGITKDVQFIPIIKIKELLSQNFDFWGTSDFRWEYIMRGNEFFISATVTLNLLKHIEGTSHKWSFVGAATINILNPNPTMEVNENHTASVLSACIKNAAKNIGRFFGMYLNTPESYTTPLTEKVGKEAQKVITVKKTINNILKKQN